MTTSNLDLARECGAFNPGYENARPGELLFTPAQLDAFAARIRADALASAPVQPVALVNTLLLEAEKFWWNDGPEGKTADDMNAAKDAVLRALAAPQPQQIAEPASQFDAADRELRQQADPELAHLHENGAKAWADVPDATAWVDELRGSEPQAAGNVMSINYMDESGKPWRYCSKCHAHSPAEVGCAHFTAAPAPPALQPLPQERNPLTECAWTESYPCGDMPSTYESSCGELWSFIDGGPKENNVKFCHGCGYPVVVTPFQTENENGITAQQGGEK